MRLKLVFEMWLKSWRLYKERVNKRVSAVKRSVKTKSWLNRRVIIFRSQIRSVRTAMKPSIAEIHLEATGSLVQTTLKANIPHTPRASLHYLFRCVLKGCCTRFEWGCFVIHNHGFVPVSLYPEVSFPFTYFIIPTPSNQHFHNKLTQNHISILPLPKFNEEHFLKLISELEVLFVIWKMGFCTNRLKRYFETQSET